MKDSIRVINDKQFSYKDELYTLVEAGVFTKEGSDKKYSLQPIQIFGTDYIVPLPVDEISKLNSWFNSGPDEEE